MPERRKHPRYPIKLRVFFVEEGIFGVTENVSLDGLFVKADANVSEGVVKDLLVEIPVLGVIALKGYIQHTQKDRKGLGVELVKVRFSTDQEIYCHLYNKFIECLQELAELHEQYLEFAHQGKVKLCTFPKEAPSELSI
ncbi:hypothetical protein DBT_1624 [Dissulfuribacter thermophilus]|uniref:PilZ domain-containing protein n=1 Tax=Dissulfuribacter thermophilus TaxID=1156395 RepID=A0A1B9F5B1_9BACT|nr:PilZ domain-containing protein [Dissulfuribacter thermophilus]OCC15138.1 hypothetical protein DBT_1624 [Dissulfuribacter thermophilus]